MGKKSLESILLECPFFKDFEPEFIQPLLDCALNVCFEKGQLIFKEGEEADSFYVISEGQASLEINSVGRGTVQIETLGTGDVLGWSWLFPPYRWHFDARVIDRIYAIVFDGRSLREKCSEDPAFGYELMRRFSKIMVERLQATRLRVIDIYGIH